jgi:hypothetical protein
MNKPLFQQQLFLLAVLFLVAAVPAHAQQRPNIVVEGFSVMNGSASPGSDFVLVVQLINTEPQACAVADTATIQAGSPFILKGVSSLPVGDICNGTAAVVNFPLQIDPTATGGTYQLSVTNNYETVAFAQFSSTSTINLFVNGAPELRADIVGSDPVDVYPGDTATLSVSIQNDGSFQAQAVTANLSADAPVEAVWSSSFASLGSLDAKQGKSASFVVEVPKDAAAIDYPLHLSVAYRDENLALQHTEFALILHVKPKALFLTIDAGSDALYQDQSGRTVRLLLKNTGTDAARKVKASILPQYPFSTDGSVRYIDILEPGQSVPVTFTVNVDKDGTPGTYGLNMLVNFEDNQGKSFQDDTTKVALTVRSKGFFRAVFLDYWFLWLAAVVIVVLVARKRVAAKKKKV